MNLPTGDLAPLAQIGAMVGYIVAGVALFWKGYKSKMFLPASELKGEKDLEAMTKKADQAIEALERQYEATERLERSQNRMESAIRDLAKHIERLK